VPPIPAPQLVHITCAGLFTRAAQFPQKLRAALGGKPQDVHATAPAFIAIPQFVQRPPYEGVNDISISSNPPSASAEAPPDAISEVAPHFLKSLGADTQFSRATENETVGYS